MIAVHFPLHIAVVIAAAAAFVVVVVVVFDIGSRTPDSRCLFHRTIVRQCGGDASSRGCLSLDQHSALGDRCCCRC